MAKINSNSALNKSSNFKNKQVGKNNSAKKKSKSERNQNSRKSFKSKNRLSGHKKNKNKENVSNARSHRRVARNILNCTDADTSNESNSNLKKINKKLRKRRPKPKPSRLPSFLEKCQVISETTLIDISDDDSQSITILDKTQVENKTLSTTLTPDDNTITSSTQIESADVTIMDVNKNERRLKPQIKFCGPIFSRPVTDDYLSLDTPDEPTLVIDDCEEVSLFANDEDAIEDVVFVSDTEETYSAKKSCKRFTKRWQDKDNDDSVIFMGGAPSPIKMNKSHSLSEMKQVKRLLTINDGVPISSPKRRRASTKDIGLSPIVASPGNRKNSRISKLASDGQMSDMSALESLSALKKLLALPNLQSVLENLGKKPSTSTSSTNLVNEVVESSSNNDLNKTYSSSGEFISNNIYLAGKIETRGLRPIVIDGSNIAMTHSNGRFFSVKGLKICIDFFKGRGHKVYAFIPSYRLKRNQSSDQNLLMDLVKRQLVFCTASRDVLGHKICSYDDRILVQVASAMNAVIVSSDNYRDLIHEDHRLIPVIKNNLLIPTWVGDMIIFPDDPLGRFGPKLNVFLRFLNN